LNHETCLSGKVIRLGLDETGILTLTVTKDLYFQEQVRLL
jgi:hypothetical protein